VVREVLPGRGKMNTTLAYMAEAIRSAWEKPFRGEIWQYARKLNLQNGYAVKGEFDIETARHLLWPLRAIRDPDVLIMSVMAAVQTLKSLIADICNPFWIETDGGDCLWLFEDDPKAKLYGETRAMPLINSVPEIKALLADVDRHDKTKTSIKFKHMNLVMAGLNLGNVQSLSWRRVIIDEGWMHRSDGLIRQAKDRTKQYPDTKKILFLGQGGVEDDDADREHKETVRYELHFACPGCGKFQPFELVRERPPDFPIEKLRGTCAGLSWDVNEATRPDGRWNYEAVGKTANHRCFYCDYRIEDTPEVRRKLNDSYTYFLEGVEPTPETEIRFPLPKGIGFHWPAEASMRIPFNDLAVKYLRAKVAAEEMAYRLPLQEFYQKDRGRPWSESLEAEYRAVVREPYDVTSDWADEAYRTVICDCQKDLQKFFVGVFAVALNGESRELYRGVATSFDGIAEAQKLWKVHDQHVFLDCGYNMTKVLRECVKHGHKANLKIGGQTKTIWRSWTGLKGSGAELFRHRNPKTGLFDHRIFSERKFYNVNIGTKDRHPRAPWYEWSNLHCKDLLRDRRDGDPAAPKFLTLPDTLPSNDPWSHFAQMRSERRVEQWTPRGNKSIWLPIKQSAPNHEWDKAAMLIAYEAIIGVIGSGDEDQAGQGAGASEVGAAAPV
jgi:Phage terminase large subunit gpA, ATPase domain